MYITAKEWNLGNIINEINKLERAYDRAEGRRQKALEDGLAFEASKHNKKRNEVAEKLDGMIFVLTQLGLEVQWDDDDDRHPAKAIKQGHSGSIYGTLDWCDMIYKLMYVLKESDDNNRKKEWVKRARDKGVITNDEALDLYIYFED